MDVIALPKKQYNTLIKRQERIEKELALLREVVREQAYENFIRPSALKTWEKISNDLDSGKRERSFTSAKGVKTWLKNL